MVRIQKISERVNILPAVFADRGVRLASLENQVHIKGPVTPCDLFDNRINDCGLCPRARCNSSNMARGTTLLGRRGGEMSSSEEVETLPMSMVSPSGLVALVRRGGMIVMEGII